MHSRPVLSTLKWVPLFAALLHCPAITHAADEAVVIAQSLRVPDGLEVSVWARAPMFYNPTSIDVDERGRIWVAEAVNYRGFNNKKNAPIWHEKGDRIVILEDADGDGRADESKVFVQDADLVAPLGVAVIGDKVIVSCSPNLIVYTRDGNDKVVKKEILLTGFGGFDHDHALHAVEAGPDGRWYFTVGNAGPHVVTDKSGWTLRAGSWYTGGSPYNDKNTPGLKSDDGRIYTGGLMLAVNPDGTDLRVLGHSMRNPYGCIDSFGNLFVNDNDDTQSCRTTYLMRYGDCGYNSKDGARSWQADRRPGQSIPAAHWRQDDPGVIPSGHVYGNGAPTGMTYYEGGALGEAYKGGLLLSCDAGQNVVWAYHRKPQGAGFELEGFPFLTSTGVQDPNYIWSKAEQDRRMWFRPSDVLVGTDGCIYVADWYDAIVGGHQMTDKAGTGTIYRITPKGQNPNAPKYDTNTIDGAIEVLKSPAVNVRSMAYGILDNSDPKEVERKLGDLTRTQNIFLRARAAWLHDRVLSGSGFDADINQPSEIQVLEMRLREPELSLAINDFEDATLLWLRLKYAIEKGSPAVRREVALCMRDWPYLEWNRTPAILTEIARRYDGRDRWYLEALGTGCEGKEEQIYAHLLGAMGALPLKWSDAFADIAWRLHPVTAVPAFKDRAMAAQLSHERRRQAIDSLAFVFHKSAAEAMVGVASKGPEDLREYAAWWVEHRSRYEWRDFGVAGIVAPAGSPKGPPAFSSGVLKRGYVDIDIHVAGASTLWLVASDAGNGNSCDWVDWLDGTLTDKLGKETRLTALKWKSAKTGWAAIHIGKGCTGGPLVVNGQTYDDGIGAHAPATIAYALDGKFARLKLRAAVDDGDPEQGGATYKEPNASVQFFVYHDGPSERDMALTLRQALMKQGSAMSDRTDAAKQLAATGAGGHMLLQLAETDALPGEVRSAVAELIHRNPDPGVRALAGRHFPRTDAAGRALPAIDDLAKLEGDAQRGEQVFLSSKSACSQCHMLAGQGREVGPDLTKIAEKFDRRGLFDAILNPSAAILVGYEAQQIETGDGEVIVGMILSDGDTVVIKDTAGAQHALEKKSIVRREPLKVSIMPDNVAMGLSAQELADLVSYLQQKKSN